MTSADNGHMAHIRAFTPQSIEQKINQAVDSAQNRALQEGHHGVKVTRHSPTAFTVAVSPDVAYGWTMEQDEFCSN
ncbi:hypothetical protein [Arthrobacter sp. B2a2-09]|uniref:hypothetical protein n=1 Tax=Arthrobacter sp. B2a2-09 TaxID=2952822 RepID=UPI0022CD275F|nr:hypothetical protein [Arthrobacter sp. B2a2-09]MCZ9884742.1 hypothetical protein [Arthrobacter sp. B2a2-09]